MRASLRVVNNDLLKALQDFLRQLLQAGVVEALLVPMRTPSGSVTPALVTDPALLSDADPLAPVMATNSAALAGKLSVRAPRARIGVLMRACELRALVELTKMQQASPEDLTLIALDCAGTYSVPVFEKKRKSEKEGASWLERYREAETQPAAPDPELRQACRICEQPVYEDAAIRIELFGSVLHGDIRLSLPDEIGEKLGLEVTEPAERTAVVEKLVAARLAQRDAEFAALRDRLEGPERLTGVFGACIGCHNCMTVCPICYCKTCVFKSPIFDHEPMQYVNWAKQKGAYRLPADTLLFHLTRLNHMGLSCVGCGMCTEACPAELPVGLVFRATGQRLQTVFDYAPGRRLDEPLPLVTFKEDEWSEVGE